MTASRPPYAIATRLAAAATAVLLLFVAIAAFALHRGMRDSLLAAREDRLQELVYLVMASVEIDSFGRVIMPTQPPESKLAGRGSGLYAQIGTSEGVLWRSESSLGQLLPALPPLAPGKQQFQLLNGDRRYLSYAFGSRWSGGGKTLDLTFRVLEEATTLDEQLRRFRTTLTAWFAGLAGILAALQVALLRWGFAPLKQIGSDLQQVDAGESDQLQGRYPRELAPLADTLNNFIRHEQARQKRSREALGNLAHSLKTPLAVLQGELQALPPDRRTLAEAELTKMNVLIGYQLQRAALTATHRRLAPLRAVAPVAERIALSLGKVYRDQNIQFDLQLQPQANFRGDEGDLLELLGNLLDNACKYGQGMVRVIAKSDAEELQLTVEDNGPGIAAEAAAAVMQRGVRADERVAGQGIGLAVVGDLVAHHDGELQISRSDLGGAAIQIRLPLR